MKPFKLSETDLEKVNKAAAIITTSLTVHYTIAVLAKKIPMAEKRMKYAFKHAFGVGVFTYLRHKRLEAAKALMLKGEKIKDIIPKIGYSNETNFSKAFRKVYKELPADWRKRTLGKTG